jgi:hypothetical protein
MWMGDTCFVTHLYILLLWTASVVLYETSFVYEAQQTRTPFLCLKMDTDPGPETLYICIMHRCIRARAHNLVLLKLDMNMSHLTLTLLMPK